jgi:hypothetical protein
MMQLKSPESSIPGGFMYPYPDGIRKNTMIKEAVKALLDFRRGNKLPRATFNECLEDIDTYNAQRLGGMKQYFKYTLNTSFPTYKSTAMHKPCGGCGAHIK